MVALRDISQEFDWIIDTPEKRRRQVDEASEALRQRYSQSRRPFSLLGGGIAGSIPGITENIRRGLVGAGGQSFRTPGENIAEQLRRIDTSTEAGQRQAVQIVAQIDPGRAEALKQYFDQKSIDAERRAFDREKFAFEKERFEEQKRAALVDEKLTADQLIQRVAEFNADSVKGEGLEQYYRGVAANFAPGTPKANPQLFALYQSAAVNNIPHAAVAQTIDAISGNRSDIERELQIQAITFEEAENLLFQLDNGIIVPEISEDGQVTIANIPAAIAQAQRGEGNGATLPVARLSPGVYENVDYGFQDTLYSLAPYIPGVINKTIQLFNRVAPQMDPSLFAQRQSVATALVNNVSLDLYAAVRQSLGAGRLSNQMIQLIENSIGIKGEFFDSEQNYRSVLRMNSERLRSLAVQLRSELEQGVFSDPGRRSDAQQQLSALNKAIQQFGVPEIIAASEFTPELIDITDSGILRESIAAMGPERFSAILGEENSALRRAIDEKGL